MARTDEAAIFFHAVYSAVQEIPHGKVTSYAHIAMLVGTRKTLYQPVSSSTPSATTTPTSGRLSQPNGAQNQAEALRGEGVEVTRTAMGEFMVNFDEYGWFPRALPSEAVSDEAWESSTGDEAEADNE
ncbi:6-O-methylguanine DNA methyltransferase, DNA binding domain-containing protein [Pochonia chlamydosporia 170]|uniref:6-O-methylguanine DNA methyltransferase, DNA binding domain-containing protein n=1 Tax=Pochonia chlamydosporia 170 TaxID=1380566 RepID=A0A219ANX3_METCM|nr:6-O-methylguanine DNA methyltransferase, DNA binding domain-containing protein [Pochonia chlamydosporia 170]OWT42526.1 6-O-methylguanine DNA methyltransferase, DNA binding domain-containing protein [Pochonia chlamydosporia 170]